MNGIRIGRLFGIKVAIHPSWFLILGLFTFTLATGFFPRAYAAWSPIETWSVAASATVLLFASVLAHEFGHALVAKAQGIPVSSITLFLLGGVSTIEQDAASPGREALLAGVGPLVSLVLGAGAWLAATVVSAPQPIHAILLYLGLANITLAVFNLLPAYPMDGGRILSALFWWGTGDRLRAMRGAAAVGKVMGYLLVALAVLQVLGGSLVGGLWLGLIGGMVIQGSRSGVVQALLRRDLDGATATRIMSAPAGWLRPFVTLSSATQDAFADLDSRCLAVEPEEEGQVFDGLVCARDLEAEPRSQWDVRRVRDAMVPARDVPVVAPDTPALDVVRLMQTRRADRVAVVDQGELRGFVDVTSIDRYLRRLEARRHRESRLTAA